MKDCKFNINMMNFIDSEMLAYQKNIFFMKAI